MAYQQKERRDMMRQNNESTGNPDTSYLYTLDSTGLNSKAIEAN